MKHVNSMKKTHSLKMSEQMSDSERLNKMRDSERRLNDKLKI